MTENNLSAPQFTDANKAREYLESIVWPNGPVCPHCGGTERNSKLHGKGHREGLYFCGDCREQFTVTVGSVFERSKIPLNKWLMAAYLIASSKKGISAHQLHRTLQITYKSAWFLAHRIREAMKSDGGMFGTSGGTVEADATYVGGKEKNKHRNKRDSNKIGGLGKECVFSLVERGGNVRSFHISGINMKYVKPLIEGNVNAANIHLMTDGERPLRSLKKMFATHQTVSHDTGEYVRGNIHTNTIEGYFSIMKRGIIGTFHHVSAKHLQRYATEFDFRYNHRESKEQIDGKWIKTGYSDAERCVSLLKGIKGRRLTYKGPASH